jgi:hypothetical protein
MSVSPSSKAVRPLWCRLGPRLPRVQTDYRRYSEVLSFANLSFFRRRLLLMVGRETT